MDLALPLGALILGATVGVWIAYSGWPSLVEALRRQSPRGVRKVIFVVKWVRSYTGNLLWLLGLTPVWIALGAAAVAWVSYLFFTRPFLARTRNRP